MKKLIALLLTFTLIVLLAACAPACTDHVDSNNDGKCDICEAPVEKDPCDECVDSDNDGKCDECGKTVEPDEDDGIMSYAEYAAAAVNDPVKVKTYVQAKQGWWDNKGVFYTQAPDGAYFIYNMACSQDEYNLLTPGTCIIVTGYKAEFSGELEIVDATYEIVADEAPYIAPATDMTADFAAGADLLGKQNVYFSVSNAIVIKAPMYKWNGSGAEGDDIYLTISIGGNDYVFVVESYLHGNGSAVYEAVEALEVGDTINIEAFLYWYDGPQPHINAVSVAAESTLSSYEEFMAAELNTEHTVITYVQAKQSWWDNKAIIYTQSPDGAYFLYNLACTEEEYALLTPGTCIMVTGYKAQFSGEYELVDMTYTILGDNGYIASAADHDFTSKFANSEDLIGYQNYLVSVKGAVVSVAPMYKWNGSGAEGDDIYLTVTVGEATYTLVVESYLHGNGSEVYEAVEALVVGDVIDVEMFLYWYDGPQPHINAVTKK